MKQLGIKVCEQGQYSSLTISCQSRIADEGSVDGWPTSHPSQEGLNPDSIGINPETIGDMVRAIAADELPLTHSVLVARNGKLVVEEYFYGFDRMTWHDV